MSKSQEKNIAKVFMVFALATALIAASMLFVFGGSNATAQTSRNTSAATSLAATVGPGFTITLTKGGTEVKTLKPGKYRIKVSDKSSMHNFHLKGPGVDKKTSVSSESTTTWNVTLKKGSYTYLCDPHPSSMTKKFKVK